MSEWKVDPEKFSQPATKGDLAFMAIWMQRLISSVRHYERMTSISDNKYLQTLINECDDIDRKLEEFQVKNVGLKEVE